MRRTLGSVGAWLIATSLAVLVSWLGVRSVLFAAVPDRVAPMSAAEARQVVPKSASPTPTVSPTAESPTPDATESPVATASTPTPTKPAPSPSDDGWTKVPDGRGGTGFLRTVRTDGGTARIRFTATDVRVTSTDPAPGFTVSFEQQEPTVAIVTFTSSDHTSRITAFWERGARAQISEDPGGR
jgi:hypothetical protein